MSDYQTFSSFSKAKRNTKKRQQSQMEIEDTLPLPEDSFQQNNCFKTRERAQTLSTNFSSAITPSLKMA